MKNTRAPRRIRLEQSSGNVYADLHYVDPEDMLVKARLVAKIADIIRQRGLTQAQTARLLRLTQPKVSSLLKGRFSGISERRLLRCLTRLGRDVEIRVKPAPPRRQGRLTVYVA
jgi:predicted XRE-type DNA-binding protein